MGTHKQIKALPSIL